MTTDPAHPEKDHPVSSGVPFSKKRAVRSEELLKDEREVILLHGEEEYRLRVTRNGKLILTK